MKKCSIEGCSRPLFGKNFCKQHYPSSLNKKPLLKSRGSLIQRAKNSIIRYKPKDEYLDKRREFFLSIWRKREHKSEVSGTPLGNVPNSMYFHHILEKRNYPEAIWDEENIILLTPNEHTNVEGDKFRYEEINKRRILLKLKYHIL